MTLLRTCAVATAAVAIIAAQEGPKGPRPTQMTLQERDRGRVQTHGSTAAQTVSGVLVDASCRDRTTLNLRQKPVTDVAGQRETAQPSSSTAPKTPPAGDSSDSARQSAIAQMVPDALAREEDMSCAVTGGTTNYALLLDDGRLLNMDQGGNTLAAQAVQSTAEGRAMLNGAGPAFKPRVKVRGRVGGDEIVVEKIDSLR